MYRLKTTSAAFEIVDGPFAGRKYLHGKTYAEVPPQEKDKFEKVGPTKKAEAAMTKTVGAEPAKKAEGGKKIEKYFSKL
jgi:hypothetical protein